MQHNDVSNLRDTIIPKSDQLNAEQLLAGPITITVTSVQRGTADQPVVVYYDGNNGRPYKPCKSMRKVLIFAWGEDGAQWVGRSMTLYNNTDVMFGGMKVGGIRISHLSHIERNIELSLTSTKGKKAPHTIAKLAAKVSPADAARNAVNLAASNGTEALKAAWQGLTLPMRKELGEQFLQLCKARAAEADKRNQQQQEQSPAPAAPAEPAPTNSAEVSSQQETPVESAAPVNTAAGAPADDGFDF